jgi:hypothetical protein
MLFININKDEDVITVIDQPGEDFWINYKENIEESLERVIYFGNHR